MNDSYFPEYDKPLEEPIIDPIDLTVGSGLFKHLLSKLQRNKMKEFAARMLAKKLENKQLFKQGQEAFGSLNESLSNYKKGLLNPTELVEYEKQFLPKSPSDIDEVMASSQEARSAILDKLKKMRDLNPTDPTLVDNPLLKASEEITRPTNIESFHKFKQLQKTIKKRASGE